MVLVEGGSTGNGLLPWSARVPPIQYKEDKVMIHLVPIVMAAAVGGSVGTAFKWLEKKVFPAKEKPVEVIIIKKDKEVK